MQWPGCLAVALLGALVHYRCLTIGYLSDDFNLMGLVTSEEYSPLSPFPAGSGRYYRPLVLASLWLIEKVNPSASPLPHHLVNLLAHLGCGLLVFWISWFFSRNRWLALAAAACFTLHFANVTNVYWISGRTDVLCAFFFLFALASFARYHLHGGRFPFFLMVIAWLGAVASKETGITLVVVCACLALFCQRIMLPEEASQAIKRAVRALIVLGALSLAYLLFLYLYFYRDAMGQVDITTTGAVVVNLLKSAFFALSPFDPDDLKRHPGLIIPGGVVLLVVSAVTLYRARPHFSRTSLWSFPVLVAMPVIVLLPVLLFLDGAAARFLYLSIALMCVGAAVWVAAHPGTAKWVTILLVTGSLLMAPNAVRQGSIWVGNNRLIEACYDSFRELADKDRPKRLLVFLTAPGSFRNNPIFANDLNPALFHALHGRFGRFPNCAELGMVSYYGLEINMRRTDDSSRYSFERHIELPDYFHFGTGVKKGDIHHYARGTTLILEDGGSGRVTGFSYTIDPGFRQPEPLVFDFNGRVFELVPSMRNP